MVLDFAISQRTYQSNCASNIQRPSMHLSRLKRLAEARTPLSPIQHNPNSLSTDVHRSYTAKISQHATSSLFPYPSSCLSPLPHLLPSNRTTHLIKRRHRLIRTPNLHLKICRLLAVTAFHRTLYALLFLRVIPCPWAAEDVFALRSGEGFALEIALR